MMIYEVNLMIPANIKKEYNQWLVEHIEEMLTIDGFLKVELYEIETSNPTEYELCVQYYLENSQTMINYEQHHAERMRGDGISRWGTQVKASRRILHHYELMTKNFDSCL